MKKGTKRSGNHHLRAAGCLFATLAIGLWRPPANADGESEFLFFVSADYLERHSVTEAIIPTSDFTPTIDVLFSHINGPWRIVAEYLLTDDEHELERLQLSCDFSADNTI